MDAPAAARGRLERIGDCMRQFRTQGSALAALAARTVLLAAGKAHLYQDDGFVPDAQSVLADLNAHEANYTGYVAGGVAIGAGMGPYVDGENNWSESFPSIIFQPVGGPITANDIRGVYFDDGAGNLEAVWIFDTPVTLATTLDAIIVEPKISQDWQLLTPPDEPL